MNPAILIVANLVLFVAFIAGSLVCCSLLVNKVVGFYYGGRFAVFTAEDAISQRKHNRLIAAISLAAAAASVLLFCVLGSYLWSCFVLTPTLATAIGIFASFKNDRRRLLPFGWPRK